VTSAPPPDDPRSQPGRAQDPWARPDGGGTSDPTSPGEYGSGQSGYDPGGYGSGEGGYGPPAGGWTAPPAGNSSSRWAPQPAPAQPEPPFDPYRFGRPEPSQQYGAYPSAPQTHQYASPRTGNGKAIAGLVLGILALVLCFLTVFDIPLIVLGIIFSALGLRAARAGAGGRGLAVAGLTCSIIGAVAATALFVFVYNRAKDCADKFDTGTTEYNNCLRINSN
jgi:hypothetical protein